MTRRVLALLMVILCVSAGLSASPAQARDDDPRWRFYTSDRTKYASPWFHQKHRIMIPYGCTRAPYYDPDRRCRNRNGFHHGMDIAIPCKTRLFAGRPGWVVSSAGLGPAYGARPLRIRNYRLGVDFVIGHARRVYVKPGQRVRTGMTIARVSDSAAPDGCHLHFEVRKSGGGLSAARNPKKLLALRR